MVAFRYNHMLQHYGSDKVKLLATETDSFIYHITNKDYSKDVQTHSQLHDLSNYDPDKSNSWLFDATNKAKCEIPDDMILEMATTVRAYAGSVYVRNRAVNISDWRK